MSFNDRIAIKDGLAIEVLAPRRAPSGKILPENLWPCHCLVCKEEMTEWSAREDGDACEVTYAHPAGHACANTQRTILGQPQLADDGPRFPCPACGKETLEHRGPPGTRICSAAFCRRVVHPSE